MSSYTPPQGKEMWEEYFMVRILYLQSLSRKHIEAYGVRISGIEEIDRYQSQREIVTQMTIDQMFEKHREGATIRVLNYDDTARIYNIINQHLIAWAEYLSRGVNVGNAPLKDLIELDAFANIVYDKARCVFTEEMRKYAQEDNFMKIQEINFFNILQNARDSGVRRTRKGIEIHSVLDTVDDEQPNREAPERNALKDLFIEEVDRIGSWRGGIRRG